LDHSVGGEVTQNLSSLYEYMNMRITDASIEKSVEPLVEVMTLMNEIKSAWDAIPREEVDKAMTLQLERG